MVDRDQDSEKESSATSDAGAEPTGTGDLPGEFLAEDLAEAPEYEVAADETEAEELSDPDDGSDEVSDEEQLEEATAVAAVAPSSRPKRREVAKKDAPPAVAVRPRSRGTIVRRRRSSCVSRPTNCAR